MRKLAILILIAYPYFSKAQQDSTSEKNLDEAIVYSNKFAENKKFLFQRMSTRANPARR